MNIIADAIQKSHSYNGYEREAALRTLLENNSSDFLSVYWNRINDWVPQVQRLAEQGIRQLIEADSSLLLAQLGELFKLKNYRRRDHSQLYSHLVATLNSPKVLAVMAQGLTTKSCKHSWQYLRLIKTQHLLTAEQLVHLAAQGTSPALASEAARILLFDLTKPDTNLLLRLSRSKAKNLRIQATKQLFHSGYNFSQPELLSLLASENIDLRRLAQAQSKFSNDQLIEHYQAMVQSVKIKERLIAIQELQHQNWQLIERYMPMLKTSLAEKIRREYWRHQLAHNPAPKLVLVAEGLKDPAPSVIKLCSDYYKASAEYFSQSALLSIETHLAPERALGCLELLLRKHNKWQRLEFWLSLAYWNQQHPEKLALIYSYIRNCLASNKSYAKLELHQRQQLLDHLHQLNHTLPIDLYQELKFTLATTPD